MNNIQQNFEGGIIYPQKEWERFLELKGVTQETIQHVLNPQCSEDFQIEHPEGVLRVCKGNEDKEEAKDALRSIALLRHDTTILIEDTCKNHSNHKASEAVQRWIDVAARVKKNNEANIIQFKK